MNDALAPLDFGGIVLGGNVFGWTADLETSCAVLDAYVDGGGTAIDTSDVYPQWAPGRKGGESEEYLGEWLRRSGARDRVTLATKVGKWSGAPGLAPDNIRHAVDASLTRLGTDHIDLYYAHRDDDTVPQIDYLGAFDELVRAGKVRALGASNFSAARIRSANEIARSNGFTPFRYAQDQWSLVERSGEQDLVPALAAEGIVELPFASLAGGFLTGKYRLGSRVDSPRAGGASSYLAIPANVALLDTLDGIASGHGVAVAAVALAWLRVQPTVGAPLASARSVAQLEPLLQSVSLRLTDEEVAALSAVTAVDVPTP